MRPDFDPTGTVRVLGYHYEVRTVAGAEADRHNFDGFHHMASGTIEVREGMTADRMAETTLHEITHAVSDGLNAEMSEEQVHLLARGLYAVCRDNKSYMKRLLFGDEDGPRKDGPRLFQIRNPIDDKFRLIDRATGSIIARHHEPFEDVPFADG